MGINIYVILLQPFLSDEYIYIYIREFSTAHAVVDPRGHSQCVPPGTKISSISYSFWGNNLINSSPVPPPEGQHPLWENSGSTTVMDQEYNGPDPLRLVIGQRWITGR